MQLNYPEVILNIDEIKALYDMEDVTGEQLNNDIDGLDQDIIIETATEHGILRREEILGIKALDTDTIEDRRFRVAAKWSDTYPYTLPNLRSRLNELVGEGNYSLELDYATMKMTCRLALERKEMYQAVVDLIEKIVPLNIVLDVSVLYNRHNELTGYTHQQLSHLTHKVIKEETVGGEEWQLKLQT